MTGATPVSDADLARAISAGGAPQAEAELLARFHRRVLLYGIRHLRDASQAEDLAQEVMATVLERLRAGEVREPERIASFVLGTARMLARDSRRKEQRHAEVELAAGQELPTQVSLADHTDLPRLSEALAQLAERERSVVVLSFQHERSAEEIGAELGMSAGNVRVVRHRAIARLALRLGARELLEPEAVR